jgi:two-component system, OmpR family, sensor histidine kinase KdpD
MNVTQARQGERVGLTARLTGGGRQLGIVALALFLLAASAATLAQQAGRPVTAAIVFLLGVTLVGALAGLRAGLAAGILASAIYNFFLSDPVFRFSLTSAEEYVPLIAFNLSAATSGLLAGLLKDRALAAERATSRIRGLLDVSERLQGAVRINDIPDAARSFSMSEARFPPEIYVTLDGSLKPIQADAQHLQLARQLVHTGEPSIRWDDRIAIRLPLPAGTDAVVVLSWSKAGPGDDDEHDLNAFVNLLGIALERCLLLERLSEAELIKHSERFKTALLSSVSHDLRTPLSVISASASSLARFSSELDEPTKADLLSTIQEQCDRLNRYTTNLLSLGHLQAGLDTGQFKQCDALDALGSAISRARLLGSGHDFAKTLSVLSAPVRADPVMLEQMFYNIVENAVKYSPDGSRIEVAAKAADGHLEVAVSDDGAGIAAEDRERVFERFYRSRTAIPHEGSGLGLSIARGFAQAFGGTVSAGPAEPPLRGARISVSLPTVVNGSAPT